jgi:hypothetical protein
VGASLAVLPLIFSPLRTVRKTDEAEELVRPFNEQFAVGEVRGLGIRDELVHEALRRA